MPDENDKPATKADISLLATKTDMAAVKTDITVLKTDITVLKTDITVLKTDITVLKTDITRLDKKIDRVAIEVVKTQGQMQQMEERINVKMDARFNQVLSAIDSFAKKSENQNTAVTLHGPILTEVQVGLKDHEQRIKTLESARP